MGKIKDLTGQRVGSLTVLEMTNERRNRQVVWKCQCDCGNITYVVGQALRTKHTQSCGCKNHQSKNVKNLIGQHFGKLTVLKRSDKKSSDRHLIWECQCECGNIRLVRSSSLLDGSVFECYDCGKHKSVGETQINELLKNNNINYIRQFSFNDCLSPLQSKLIFDFAILNENNQVKYLIEYDGIQHFQPIDYFGGIQEFEYRQQCDQIKNNYCKLHNIPLIHISYTKKGKITLEDITL